MNGSDHLLPQPWLGAGRRRGQRRRRTSTGSRSRRSREYLARAADRRACVTWRGELRSGARANVLMGVASNRVDVHQAARARRARARARRRAAQRAVPPARRLPARAARHRVAQPRAQQRARLVVRVQRRRGRRGGAGALPGGAPDRRGARPRRAAVARRRPIDAPPASTIVVNPTARGRAAAWWRSRCPATGPVHLVAVDDGAACPTQVVRATTRATASPPSSSGQKIRWVLEMMRGPELAGARIARVERRDARRRHRRVHLPRRRPGRGRESTSRRRATSCSRWARRARRSRSASGARRCARSWSRADAGPGLRLAHATAAVDGAGPATRGARRGPRARERARARSRSTPTTARSPIERRRRARSRAPTATSTAATAATPTTTRPPAVDTVVDRPESVDVDGRRVGSGARAGSSSPRTYRWPAAAIGDERVVHAGAATTTVDVDVRHHARAARRRAVPARARRARQPRAATTACARTSRSRRRSTGPTPSARSRSCTAGSTAEGGPHETGLPTFVSRRFVDCSADDVGPRARSTTGCSSTRWSTTARELALTLLRATGYLLALGARRCARTRPDRSIRSRARSCRAAVALDYAVLPHRGDWHAADAARSGRRRSSCRSNGCAAAAGAARDAAPTGQRARGRRCRGVGAPARRRPARSCVRVVNLSPNPSEATLSTPATARSPATVVDLTGAVVGAFDGSVPLRPWELLTLRVADG